MQIQLYFNNPYEISPLTIQDRLVVNFNGSYQYLKEGYIDNQLGQSSSILSNFIRPQMPLT
jgi:hypothetical protein